MLGFLGKMVGELLPEIAGFFGGNMAKEAVQWLAEAVGLSPDSSEDEIGQAIKNLPPEKLLELQTRQMECRARMEAIKARREVDILRAELSDKDSARQMHMTVRDKTPAILTFCMLGLVTLCILLLSFVDIPSPSEELLKLIFPQLMTLLGMCVAFWVGTTRGSQSKNSALVKRL